MQCQYRSMSAERDSCGILARRKSRSQMSRARGSMLLVDDDMVIVWSKSPAVTGSGKRRLYRCWHSAVEIAFRIEDRRLIASRTTGFLTGFPRVLAYRIAEVKLSWSCLMG